MIRIVLDTNTFVSGIIKKSSPCGWILQAVKNLQILLITSPSIRREIERVLRYPKIQDRYNISEQDICDLMNMLVMDAVNTKESIVLNVIREDPTDNMFLSCALEGHADCIVTGDRHLLQVKSYQNIKILSPRDFIQLWGIEENNL